MDGCQHKQGWKVWLWGEGARRCSFGGEALSRWVLGSSTPEGSHTPEQGTQAKAVESVGEGAGSGAPPPPTSCIFCEAKECPPLPCRGPVRAVQQKSFHTHTRVCILTHTRIHILACPCSHAQPVPQPSSSCPDSTNSEHLVNAPHPPSGLPLILPPMGGQLCPASLTWPLSPWALGSSGPLAPVSSEPSRCPVQCPQAGCPLGLASPTA